MKTIINLFLLFCMVYSEPCPKCQHEKEMRNHCFEDPDSGHCTAGLRNWYYDPKTRQCQVFIYGGCGGNHNNFQSRENCERECVGFVGNYAVDRPLPQDICQLRPDVGECLGHVRNWYFDWDLGECRQFVYSGCAGNQNNFLSIQECQALCDFRSRSRIYY